MQTYQNNIIRNYTDATGNKMTYNYTRFWRCINKQPQSLPLEYGKEQYTPQPVAFTGIIGEGTIPGAVSEKLCFLHILPFLYDTDTIIGDNTELIWETYLYFQEIADTAFSQCAIFGRVHFKFCTEFSCSFFLCDDTEHALPSVLCQVFNTATGPLAGMWHVH